jgi:hypothetical protein
LSLGPSLTEDLPPDGHDLREEQRCTKQASKAPEERGRNRSAFPRNLVPRLERAAESRRESKPICTIAMLQRESGKQRAGFCLVSFCSFDRLRCSLFWAFGSCLHIYL